MANACLDRKSAFRVACLTAPLSTRRAVRAAFAAAAIVVAIASPEGAQGPDASPKLPAQAPTHSNLPLRYGDFATATASAASAATLRVLQPDGSVLRTWMVGATPSRVAFVAEADGIHRLEFAARAVPARRRPAAVLLAR